MWNKDGFPLMWINGSQTRRAEARELSCHHLPFGRGSKKRSVTFVSEQNGGRGELRYKTDGADMGKLLVGVLIYCDRREGMYLAFFGYKCKAEEMAHWLRALATLVEDLGSQHPHGSQPPGTRIPRI